MSLEGSGEFSPNKIDGITLVNSSEIEGLKAPFGVESYKLLHQKAEEDGSFWIDDLNIYVDLFSWPKEVFWLKHYSNGIESEDDLDLDPDSQLMTVKSEGVVKFHFYTRPVDGDKPSHSLHAREFMKYTLEEMWPFSDTVDDLWKPGETSYKRAIESAGGSGDNLDGDDAMATWTGEVLGELGFEFDKFIDPKDLPYPEEDLEEGIRARFVRTREEV